MSFLLHSITLDGHTYPVIVTKRKHARSLTLRFKQPQQELHITAPALARKKEILAFFHAATPSITKHLRTHTSHAPVLLEEGAVIPIFGEAHRIVFAPAPPLSELPLLVVRYHHGNASNAIIKALQQRLYDHATQHIQGLLRAPAFRHLPHPTISLKDTRSRWGSCAPHHARIMLSWRLIFAPLNVAHSVMTHEVCHLMHANHSEAFWALVARHDPHYSQSNHWLKQHGKTLFQYEVSR